MTTDNNPQPKEVLPDAEHLIRYAALAEHVDAGGATSNTLAALAIAEAIHHLRAEIFRLDEGMMDKLVLAFYAATKRGEESRKQQKLTPASKPHPADASSTPDCPECGDPMKERRRKTDNKAFWGCSQFPQCTGMRTHAGFKCL